MTFFEDHILEVQFKTGTTLTLAMLVEMLEQFESRSSGLAARLIVDISGLDDIGPDVPAYFNSLIRNLRVGVLGSGPADQVLARFFMRKLDEDHTCAYFERRNDAVEFVLPSA